MSISQATRILVLEYLMKLCHWFPFAKQLIDEFDIIPKLCSVVRSRTDHPRICIAAAEVLREVAVHESLAEILSSQSYFSETITPNCGDISIMKLVREIVQHPRAVAVWDKIPTSDFQQLLWEGVLERKVPIVDVMVQIIAPLRIRTGLRIRDEVLNDLESLAMSSIFTRWTSIEEVPEKSYVMLMLSFAQTISEAEFALRSAFVEQLNEVEELLSQWKSECQVIKERIITRIRFNLNTAITTSLNSTISDRQQHQLKDCPREDLLNGLKEAHAFEFGWYIEKSFSEDRSVKINNACREICHTEEAAKFSSTRSIKIDVCGNEREKHKLSQEFFTDMCAAVESSLGQFRMNPTQASFTEADRTRKELIRNYTLEFGKIDDRETPQEVITKIAEASHYHYWAVSDIERLEGNDRYSQSEQEASDFEFIVQIWATTAGKAMQEITKFKMLELTFESFDSRQDVTVTERLEFELLVKHSQSARIDVLTAVLQRGLDHTESGELSVFEKEVASELADIQFKQNNEVRAYEGNDTKTLLTGHDMELTRSREAWDHQRREIVRNFKEQRRQLEIETTIKQSEQIEQTTSSELCNLHRHKQYKALQLLNSIHIEERIQHHIDSRFNKASLVFAAQRKWLDCFESKNDISEIMTTLGRELSILSLSEETLLDEQHYHKEVLLTIHSHAVECLSNCLSNPPVSEFCNTIFIRPIVMLPTPYTIREQLLLRGSSDVSDLRLSQIRSTEFAVVDGIKHFRESVVSVLDFLNKKSFSHETELQDDFFGKSKKMIESGDRSQRGKITRRRSRITTENDRWTAWSESFQSLISSYNQTAKDSLTPPERLCCPAVQQAINKIDSNITSLFNLITNHDSQSAQFYRNKSNCCSSSITKLHVASNKTILMMILNKKIESCIIKGMTELSNIQSRIEGVDAAAKNGYRWLTGIEAAICLYQQTKSKVICYHNICNVLLSNLSLEIELHDYNSSSKASILTSYVDSLNRQPTINMLFQRYSSGDLSELVSKARSITTKLVQHQCIRQLHSTAGTRISLKYDNQFHLKQQLLQADIESEELYFKEREKLTCKQDLKQNYLQEQHGGNQKNDEGHLRKLNYEAELTLLTIKSNHLNDTYEKIKESHAGDDDELPVFMLHSLKEVVSSVEYSFDQLDKCTAMNIAADTSQYYIPILRRELDVIHPEFQPLSSNEDNKEPSIDSDIPDTATPNPEPSQSNSDNESELELSGVFAETLLKQLPPPPDATAHSQLLKLSAHIEAIIKFQNYLEDGIYPSTSSQRGSELVDSSNGLDDISEEYTVTEEIKRIERLSIPNPILLALAEPQRQVVMEVADQQLQTARSNFKVRSELRQDSEPDIAWITWGVLTRSSIRWNQFYETSLPERPLHWQKYLNHHFIPSIPYLQRLVLQRGSSSAMSDLQKVYSGMLIILQDPNFDQIRNLFDRVQLEETTYKLISNSLRDWLRNSKNQKKSSGSEFFDLLVTCMRSELQRHKLHSLQNKRRALEIHSKLTKEKLSLHKSTSVQQQLCSGIAALILSELESRNVLRDVALDAFYVLIRLWDEEIQIDLRRCKHVEESERKELLNGFYIQLYEVLAYWAPILQPRETLLKAVLKLINGDIKREVHLYCEKFITHLSKARLEDEAAEITYFNDIKQCSTIEERHKVTKEFIAVRHERSIRVKQVEPDVECICSLFRHAVGVLLLRRSEVVQVIAEPEFNELLLRESIIKSYINSVLYISFIMSRRKAVIQYFRFYELLSSQSPSTLLIPVEYPSTSMCTSRQSSNLNIVISDSHLPLELQTLQSQLHLTSTIQSTVSLRDSNTVTASKQILFSQLRSIDVSLLGRYKTIPTCGNNKVCFISDTLDLFLNQCRLDLQGVQSHDPCEATKEIVIGIIADDIPLRGSRLQSLMRAKEQAVTVYTPWVVFSPEKQNEKISFRSPCTGLDKPEYRCRAGIELDEECQFMYLCQGLLSYTLMRQREVMRSTEFKNLPYTARDSVLRSLARERSETFFICMKSVPDDLQTPPVSSFHQEECELVTQLKQITSSGNNLLQKLSNDCSVVFYEEQVIVRSLFTDQLPISRSDVSSQNREEEVISDKPIKSFMNAVQFAEVKRFQTDEGDVKTADEINFTPQQYSLSLLDDDEVLPYMVSLQAISDIDNHIEDIIPAPLCVEMFHFPIPASVLCTSEKDNRTTLSQEEYNFRSIITQQLVNNITTTLYRQKLCSVKAEWITERSTILKNISLEEEDHKVRFECFKTAINTEITKQLRSLESDYEWIHEGLVGDCLSEALITKDDEQTWINRTKIKSLSIVKDAESSADNLLTTLRNSLSETDAYWESKIINLRICCTDLLKTSATQTSISESRWSCPDDFTSWRRVVLSIRKWLQQTSNGSTKNHPVNNIIKIEYRNLIMDEICIRRQLELEGFSFIENQSSSLVGCWLPSRKRVAQSNQHREINIVKTAQELEYRIAEGEMLFTGVRNHQNTVDYSSDISKVRNAHISLWSELEKSWSLKVSSEIWSVALKRFDLYNKLTILSEDTHIPITTSNLSISNTVAVTTTRELLLWTSQFSDCNKAVTYITTDVSTNMKLYNSSDAIESSDDMIWLLKRPLVFCEKQQIVVSELSLRFLLDTHNLVLNSCHLAQGIVSTEAEMFHQLWCSLSIEKALINLWNRVSFPAFENLPPYDKALLIYVESLAIICHYSFPWTPRIKTSIDLSCGHCQNGHWNSTLEDSTRIAVRIKPFKKGRGINSEIAIRLLYAMQILELNQQQHVKLLFLKQEEIQTRKAVLNSTSCLDLLSEEHSAISVGTRQSEFVDTFLSHVQTYNSETWFSTHNKLHESLTAIHTSIADEPYPILSLLKPILYPTSTRLHIAILSVVNSEHYARATVLASERCWGPVFNCFIETVKSIDILLTYEKTAFQIIKDCVTVRFNSKLIIDREFAIERISRDIESSQQQAKNENYVNRLKNNIGKSKILKATYENDSLEDLVDIDKLTHQQLRWGHASKLTTVASSQTNYSIAKDTANQFCSGCVDLVSVDPYKVVEPMKELVPPLIDSSLYSLITAEWLSRHVRISLSDCCFDAIKSDFEVLNKSILLVMNHKRYSDSQIYLYSLQLSMLNCGESFSRRLRNRPQAFRTEETLREATGIQLRSEINNFMKILIHNSDQEYRGLKLSEVACRIKIINVIEDRTRAQFLSSERCLSYPMILWAHTTTHLLQQSLLFSSQHHQHHVVIVEEDSERRRLLSRLLSNKMMGLLESLMPVLFIISSAETTSRNRLYKDFKICYEKVKTKSESVFEIVLVQLGDRLQVYHVLSSDRIIKLRSQIKFRNPGIENFVLLSKGLPLDDARYVFEFLSDSHLLLSLDPLTRRQIRLSKNTQKRNSVLLDTLLTNKYILQ